MVYFGEMFQVWGVGRNLTDTMQRSTVVNSRYGDLGIYQYGWLPLDIKYSVGVENAVLF